MKVSKLLSLEKLTDYNSGVFDYNMTARRILKANLLVEFKLEESTTGTKKYYRVRCENRNDSTDFHDLCLTVEGAEKLKIELRKLKLKGLK